MPARPGRVPGLAPDGRVGSQGEEQKGPPEKLLSALDDFGRFFGLTFQITDDLLDVEGQAAKTGKGVNKDAARGKLTYPGLLGVAESRKRADRLCEQAERQVETLGLGGQRLTALARSLLGRDR